MANYSSEIKTVLDSLLIGRQGVQPGKMFGFPAYYAGKKLCICLYEQCVGVKLPEASAAKLLREDPNTVPFQPMGRPKMREWIQINLASPEEYTQYEAIFEESIQYLLVQQAGGE